MKLTLINSNYGVFKNDDGESVEFANVQGFDAEAAVDRGGDSFSPGFSGIKILKMSCTPEAAKLFNGIGVYDLAISIKNKQGVPVAFCQNMKKL